MSDGPRTYRPRSPEYPPDEDSASGECAICMDKLFDRTNGYIIKLHCGHYFHSNCIYEWQHAGESTNNGNYEEGVTFLQSGYQMPGRKCPLCRAIASDDTVGDGILRLRL